jgi:signal recognition particle subunit SEC65
MSMETISIIVDEEKAQAIKQILRAFEIEFHVEKTDDYNPQFVEKIQKRIESAQKNQSLEIEPNNLWGSIGF